MRFSKVLLAPTFTPSLHVTASDQASMTTESSSLGLEAVERTSAGYDNELNNRSHSTDGWLRSGVVQTVSPAMPPTMPCFSVAQMCTGHTIQLSKPTLSNVILTKPMKHFRQDDSNRDESSTTSMTMRLHIKQISLPQEPTTAVMMTGPKSKTVTRIQTVTAQQTQSPNTMPSQEGLTLTTMSSSHRTAHPTRTTSSGRPSHPSNTKTSDTAQPHDFWTSKNQGIIAGLGIGGAVLILIIIWWWCLRRKPAGNMVPAMGFPDGSQDQAGETQMVQTQAQTQLPPVTQHHRYVGYLPNPAYYAQWSGPPPAHLVGR